MSLFRVVLQFVSDQCVLPPESDSFDTLAPAEITLITGQTGPVYMAVA